MAGSPIDARERTLFGDREEDGVTVFEASLTFFVLALVTILANAWDVRWLSLARTRWFSTACIVLGIVSLLV
ncbi:hypothetical protein [Halalkalicoccus tibetensis]|uniref:Uncharacterized protein n=1 Tax=Halalkalicoccus tibetensis TaxID=175632 RepID=A0ABD5V7T4_9EURY